MEKITRVLPSASGMLELTGTDELVTVAPAGMTSLKLRLYPSGPGGLRRLERDGDVVPVERRGGDRAAEGHIGRARRERGC